jgi:hypothetical protein
MIVYLANKSQFREDILSNRIEEIVHESFKRQLGKSVSASELASWKHSLRQMDSVLVDDGIPHNPEISLSNPPSAPLGGLCALAVQNSFLSQFRCNGSDGYLAWRERVLEVRETANTRLEGANYEFKVCVIGYAFDTNAASNHSHPEEIAA